MKKFFTVLLSVILVLAFASTGVFAVSDFSNQPLPLVTSGVGQNAATFNAGLNIASNQYGSYSAFSTTSDSIYCFVIPYSSSYRIYYCTASTPANVSVLNYDGSSYSWLNNINNQSVSWVDSTTQLYYWYQSAGSSLSFNIPQFSSADEGFAAVLDLLAPSTSTFNFSLPYGNVLRISSESEFTIIRRAYTIQNSTYNFQKYVRSSDDFTYRVNGSYQGVVLNSAISGNFGPAVFGSDNVLSLLIPWQPVNQNILGRATDYNYYNASPDPTAEVSVSTSQSFLIWYPYYANNQDTSKLNEVPMQISIVIQHSSPISFTTYPITGSTSSAGEDTYISNTASSSDSGGSQQIDDGDGNVVVSFDNAPTAGGNHGQAPINDNNSILGVLSNLQNTLLGLFNKAIDGIHNLISLGSSFLQSVQVMFSWLPGELLVIITSGFVILLTIGVLKTLWR